MFLIHGWATSTDLAYDDVHVGSVSPLSCHEAGFAH